MTELKCPFCGKELEKNCDWVYGCPNRKCKAFGYFFGARELWQELIRTRKALETIQEFVTKLYLNGNITDEQLERYKKMLIRAQEQKD